MKVELSEFVDELDVGWKRKWEIRENFGFSYWKDWYVIKGLEKILGEEVLRRNKKLVLELLLSLR